MNIEIGLSHPSFVPASAGCSGGNIMVAKMIVNDWLNSFR
jgi:hypothetical protein